MESSKPIGPLTLAMTMAGFYLGAGYLSGQELWQFFGLYGISGICGMILAISLIMILGIVLFRVCKISGELEFDKVAIRFEIPWLRTAFSYIEIIFTFCVFMIMSAGGGALLEQVFGLKIWIGSGIFCLCVALVAIKGLSGMMASFRFLVPVLTAVTLAVALFAAIKHNGAPIILKPIHSSHTLTGNWAFSAITYLSYNFFGAICIFPPIVPMLSERSIRLGSALCGAILLSIAMAVFLSMAMFPESSSAQLPMLAIASKLSPYLTYICAVPLLFGMFGTSLSSLVAVLAYGELQFPQLARKRPLTVSLLSILTWCCSLVGFGELIGILYPLCGYVGFIAIGMLLEHYIWLTKTRQNKCESI